MHVANTSVMYVAEDAEEDLQWWLQYMQQPDNSAVTSENNTRNRAASEKTLSLCGTPKVMQCTDMLELSMYT